jgi:hypothetical protein
MNKSGWLQKRSSGLYVRFQRRYVTQNADTITLRPEEQSAKIREYAVVQASAVKAGGNDFTVRCSDGRTLLLRATSSTERDEWLRALALHEAKPTSDPAAKTTAEPAVQASTGAVASSVAPPTQTFATSDLAATAPAHPRAAESGRVQAQWPSTLRFIPEI